jgi:hypothetical protein
MTWLLPYLLWVLAVATFVPIISNNYNPQCWELGALVNRWNIHLYLATPPWLRALPISGRVLMFIKLAQQDLLDV